MNIKQSFVFAAALLLSTASIKAQSYTEAFDSVFTYVSRNDATTGILYERVLPFGNLTKYNSQECAPDTSHYSHFLRAYYELCRATFNPTIPLISHDSLKKIAESSSNNIQIGLLHFDINTFDTNILSNKLYYDFDSVLREDVSISASLYRRNTLFVASPLVQTINISNPTYIVNNRIYFDNTRNPISRLYIDFDDGLGYQLVQMNQKIKVEYSNDGIKILRFMAVMTDNETYFAYAKTEINTESRGERSTEYPYIDDFVGNNAIEAIITPPNPYEGNSFTTAKGNVRIYYANSDKKLRKPILIIDGFDPQNNRQFDTCYEEGKKSLWDMMFYTDNYNQRLNLCLQLLNMGYDVVMLDLPEGGTYIERNAMVCIEVLNRLNNMLHQNNSDEQIVVVGPSMGGQIARYALTYMEQHPDDANTHYGKHNTRLWISYDSPHQGANIAMGAQYLIEYFADEFGLGNISNIWNNTLCCPAAKQMLIHHADLSAFLTHYMYYYYLTHLNNTNGYPVEVRRIAVSNGSFNDISNGVAGGISYNGTIIAPFNLIINPLTGLPLPYFFINLQMRNVANSGSCMVVSVDAFIGRVLSIHIPMLQKSFSISSENSSPDVSPGGTYDTYDQVDRAIKNIPLLGSLTAVTSNQRTHCFMPITSTLDIGGNMNYSTDISSRDLVAEGLTQFDSYAGVMDSNMYHVTFNQHLVDYMLNEIETYVQGPREVQLCQTPRPTYTLHLPQDSMPADVTWLCSDNIRIIRTSDPNVVNIVALSVGDGWISAEVPTLKHRKRLANYPIHVSVNENNNLPVITTSDIPQQTMTISNEVLLPDTFCVGDGKTLTITNTGILHCSPGTRLIIRPGGKLVVDGGVLTSSCANEMWQGIEVVGDRTKHQTASFQGVVELKNGAIIENAHCAIKTGLGDDNWHTTGGIIKASNTTFRNNRRAVAFLSYVDTAASGSLRSNYSYFRNCTFTVNEDNVFAQNNGDFIDHVTMWQVKGVNFYSCHFSNTASMNDRRHAIYTEDAGFSISKFCPITQPDCPCEIVESLRNTFTGFNIAIDVNTSGDQFPVTIDHSKFINNATGIRINGNHFVTITRNDFDLQDIPTSGITNIGLLMYNSTGYKVEGNRFHRAVTNPYITPCGILMEQSGTENNNIYLNSFDTLYEGLYISGINGDVSGGLQMTCNEFLGNRYDIYMTSSAVVSPWQGHSGKGADNIFDNHSTYNLYNCGTQYITYFYSNNSSFYPAHVTSNVMRVGGASTNPRTPTFCNIGGGVPIGGGGIKSTSGFQSDVDDYLSALTNSVDEMDNENNSDSSPESLRNMRHALSNTYYENVRKLMADTLLSLSELEQWHTIAQPIADPYSLTETKFQNGNPNSTVIAEALEETNNYADFHALKTLCGAGGSGINWYELTDSQIEQLQSIAELNTGRTSVMAKGILCFFFGICYEDDWSIEVTSETRSAKATPNNNETSSLFVYPNPTDNTLYVELLGSVIDNVILYDLQGRIVDCKLSLEDGITTVGIGNIPAGVYLVYVTDENGNSYYQKIIKK